MKHKIIYLILLFNITSFKSFSQNTKPKIYFDKAGKTSSESNSYYYRQETDTVGYFKSYFSINNKLYFAGRILNPNAEDENNNKFSGLCTWFYKNGNVKQIRNFTEKGLETGVSKYFYESGKIWKEIEFQNGKISQNSFIEYNEDGTKSKLFEENFDNNLNEWDLYISDKSTANISNGIFEVVAYSKEGTSRYINHAIESNEYTIEAIINIKDIKENDKVGIIYGFKDWQNYNYFSISKKSLFIGSMYEGVKSTEADGMYTSAINATDNNVIKILCNGEKNYFSINGEIQYNCNNVKLFGNNIGFVLSGNTKLKAEKLIVKSIGVSGSKANASANDFDVKSTGSGIFFNANGYIITNYHVIENSNKVVVEVNENSIKKIFNAEVVTKDKENDLAIIKIKDEQFTGLSQIKYAFKENGQLEVGGSVFTLGYPHALTGMGKDVKFTDGKISSKTGYDGSVNSFQSTIPVQPGNSGGPVFNTSGQLVGVINASIKDADNVSYAIKLNYIKNLIELLPDKVDIPSDISISSLSLEEKIKLLSNYVVLIKVK